MTRKIMSATFKELWDNRLLVIVMFGLVLWCSGFHTIYTAGSQIDYNETYVDIMYASFFNYLQFAVCACVVNGFHKLGKNRFWDVELSCGVSFRRYVNTKFVTYMLVAMGLAVMQSAITIMTMGRGIERDINQRRGSNLVTEVHLEHFLRTQVLTFVLTVIPIAVIVILMAMLVTVITRSVLPALIIDAVYVLWSLRQELSVENRFLLPARYIRNYIITIKDEWVWNRGVVFAETYTWDNSWVLLLEMLGIGICLYILLIFVLKKRRFV